MSDWQPLNFGVTTYEGFGRCSIDVRWSGRYHVFISCPNWEDRELIMRLPKGPAPVEIDGRWTVTLERLGP